MSSFLIPSEANIMQLFTDIENEYLERVFKIHKKQQLSKFKQISETDEEFQIQIDTVINELKKTKEEVKRPFEDDTIINIMINPAFGFIKFLNMQVAKRGEHGNIGPFLNEDYEKYFLVKLYVNKSLRKDKKFVHDMSIKHDLTIIDNDIAYFEQLGRIFL